MRRVLHLRVFLWLMMPYHVVSRRCGHSHVTVGQVVFVHDKVNEILFQIELHNLPTCLEAASPGSGKTIVEESLRSKRKKSGTIGMAFTAA